MILGKNNNNAGMHYVNYSHYGAGDDLGYYNKNSDEYRMNQYYEAKSQLEEMGQYDFVTNSGFIKVKNEKVDFEGQCLHARKIGFIHPKTNEYIEFTSELPDYFKKYLKKLENISSH